MGTLVCIQLGFAPGVVRYDKEHRKNKEIGYEKNLTVSYETVESYGMLWRRDKVDI